MNSSNDSSAAVAPVGYALVSDNSVPSPGAIFLWREGENWQARKGGPSFGALPVATLRHRHGQPAMQFAEPNGRQVVIRAGWGFGVSQDFARAKADTPIELDFGQYAERGCVIGYIAADPAASLGFLKYGTGGKVRVHVKFQALAEV